MKAPGWVKYLLIEAEQSGVQKTETPTKSDHIELYIRIAVCAIITLLLLV